MNKEFEEIFAKLSEVEKDKVKENIKEVVLLLQQSVSPSICTEANDELEELFTKIEGNPDLIFDKEVQEEILKFIEQRFERDKQVVIQKTSDISKFVLLMGEYLNKAITSNGSSSQNVLNIKEKIESINLEDKGVDQLSTLQTELVNAASTIEKEMTSVTDTLKTGKSQVEQLEEKVNLLEKELKKTKVESMKDHLTGLLTRRAYDDEIKRIESSFKRHKTQYAVVFFDLDYFKKVNDTYGHDCGDVILSTFAKILEKNTRDHDIVGRYGGEEFVAIVHYNLHRELLQYLKRIKVIVTSNNFRYKEHEIKVTFSAGVVSRGDHESYDNAIQKADMLLYKAKENGRNQIQLEDGKTI